MDGRERHDHDPKCAPGQVYLPAVVEAAEEEDGNSYDGTGEQSGHGQSPIHFEATCVPSLLQI